MKTRITLALLCAATLAGCAAPSYPAPGSIGMYSKSWQGKYDVEPSTDGGGLHEGLAGLLDLVAQVVGPRAAHAQAAPYFVITNHPARFDWKYEAVYKYQRTRVYLMWKNADGTIVPPRDDDEGIGLGIDGEPPECRYPPPDRALPLAPYCKVHIRRVPNTTEAAGKITGDLPLSENAPADVRAFDVIWRQTGSMKISGKLGVLSANGMAPNHPRSNGADVVVYAAVYPTPTYEVATRALKTATPTPAVALCPLCTDWQVVPCPK